MNRSVARSSAGKSASSSTSSSSSSSHIPFGEGKLLRSKHIDTLEVLEDYSKELGNLQKENKQLQQQINKYQAMNGDPLKRINELESMMQNEKETNAEMNARIKSLSNDNERQKNDLSNREIAHKQSVAELSALTKQYHSLQDLHAKCSGTQQRLDQITQQNSQLDLQIKQHVSQCKQYETQITQQSERLLKLEMQLSQPLPLMQPDAESTAALQRTKEKLAAAKITLSDREKQIGVQANEIAILQHKLLAAGAEKQRREQSEMREEYEKQIERLKDELVHMQQQHQQQLQQQAQVQAQATQTKSKSSAAAAADKIVSGGMLQREREEWNKKEQEWSDARNGMEKQIQQITQQHQREIEALQQQFAQLHSASHSSSTRSSKVDSSALSSLREQLFASQSDSSSLRNQLDTAQSQNAVLRAEHAKIAAAFNKLLAGGGGGGGGGGIGNTITIASKKGMFPEFVAVKREKEALQQQVNDLQHMIHIMQSRLTQQQSNQQTQAQTHTQSSQSSSSSSSPSTQPLQPLNLTALNAQSSQATLSRASSKRHVGSTRNLIATSGHEGGTANKMPASSSFSASSSPLASPLASSSSAALPLTFGASYASHPSASSSSSSLHSSALRRQSAAPGWPVAMQPTGSNGGHKARR